MDNTQVMLLREVLEGTPLLKNAVKFARQLRVRTRTEGGLLLVGPPEGEPWHLTAHLSDEARLNHIPELEPTLVRWVPEPGAPKHLSIGLDRLSATRRGESLLVVSDAPSPDLLERVDDVRKKGAGIFALDTGDPELEGLAHEVLVVENDPVVTFDSAQHLVSFAAGEPLLPKQAGGLRSRLGRLLDAISGPG